MQEEIRLKVGIFVDMVSNVSGSTDDGNTARRFFENIRIVSDITG